MVDTAPDEPATSLSGERVRPPIIAISTISAPSPRKTNREFATRLTTFEACNAIAPSAWFLPYLDEYVQCAKENPHRKQKIIPLHRDIVIEQNARRTAAINRSDTVATF
jgi:hypothetical protein